MKIDYKSVSTIFDEPRAQASEKLHFDLSVKTNITCFCVYSSPPPTSLLSLAPHGQRKFRFTNRKHGQAHVRHMRSGRAPFFTFFLLNLVVNPAISVGGVRVARHLIYYFYKVYMNERFFQMSLDLANKWPLS